jgi:Gpi18-like mannosyltransferase
VKALKHLNYLDVLILIMGLSLALALRLSLLSFKSSDYFSYTRGWYNTLSQQGFSAFGKSFANYNLPYLYLLYAVARFLPDLPGWVAAKIPSLFADFVSAWFAFRIVRLKYVASPFPLLAAFGVLFAPTVVLNSAFWGQADALYTSALVACLYFLLIRKNALAMLMFGISISFKAQGIFLLPLLLALFLRGEISRKYWLLVPAVMLLAIVPSWLAGRSLVDLLLIYPDQAGQYEQLSMHAPSFYAWIPDAGSVYTYFYPAGLVVAATVALLFCLAVFRSHTELTPAILVELAVISVMLMPFFLPKMHERYFYVADVFSILLAFFMPAYFFVPILMSVVSFFAYQPTLFETEPVPIGVLALGVFLLLVVLTRDALLRLYGTPGETRPPQTQ